MSSYTKAIPPEEEDEHYSLSQKGRVSMNSNAEFYQRTTNEKNPTDFLNKLCVFLLIGLLLVGIVVFTQRYMQLTQNHKENLYTRDQIQANMQSIQSHQPDKDHSEDAQQQKQIEQMYQKVTLELEKQQIVLKEPYHRDESSQLPVAQESSQSQQNSMQYTESQTNQDQLQDEEVRHNAELEESETDSNLENTLGNANSIEEALLLKQNVEKSELEKITQTNSLKEQLQLHKKVKDIYQQKIVQTQQTIIKPLQIQTDLHTSTEMPQISQQNPSTSQSKQTEGFNEQQKNGVQKIEEQNNFNTQTLKVQQIKQTTQTTTTEIKMDTTNSAALPVVKTVVKTTSSSLITEKDMFDPIIRVKSKIEQNLQSKFDDLIYIKAGTNITQDQYNKARQRMDLWKYFNPLTGSLQILDQDQVNYDEQTKTNTQSALMALQNAQKVILDERLQYERKYQVSQYNEIGFCIIIPSYKNQDKYFRNLNSILQQDYQNYHIIYIDDASKDGTAQKVQAYIDKYQVPESRLKFIENKVNKKALPNIDYAARRLCNSGEIMAIIDGDDYLIGTQVFKLINARYQKENLVMLYTNHIRVHQPIYLKVGTCIDYPERVKKSRSYRRFSIFPASHLRTFFVDLYWRISIRDLKDYQGGYFTAANDFAIMMPIMEMAGQRAEYLPELTYVYDAGTGNNNFQTKADKQAKNFKITKRRHKYPQLEHQLEFEKNLRAKGLMKPLPRKPVPNKMQESPGAKLRRNIERK